MNIVNSGGRYQVYGDNVRTYHELPVASYGVQFGKMTGFFLVNRSDLTVTEGKVYGANAYRVEKVMRSYNLTKRNFGVLLSGQKGIGKTLFVRMLAQRAIDASIPVIVVSEAIPGIADFLSSIEQDCVVIFDEFEKTFATTDDWNPQADMLSLFDGIDGGHKLFVVTVNDLSKLNSYMLNRPGRFHYHFNLGAPTQDEIREYLQDTIQPEYASCIEDIVNLSGTVDMPYDFLRAIAFEVNQGYELNEALRDLNITKADDVRFDMKAYAKDGQIFDAWNVRLDMIHRHSQQWVCLHSRIGDFSFKIKVTPSSVKFENGEYIITENIIMPVFDETDFYGMPEEQIPAAIKAATENKIERIVLKKCVDSQVYKLIV